MADGAPRRSVRLTSRALCGRSGQSPPEMVMHKNTGQTTARARRGRRDRSLQSTSSPGPRRRFCRQAPAGVCPWCGAGVAVGDRDARDAGPRRSTGRRSSTPLLDRLAAEGSSRSRILRPRLRLRKLSGCYRWCLVTNRVLAPATVLCYEATMRHAFAAAQAQTRAARLHYRHLGAFYYVGHRR